MSSASAGSPSSGLRDRVRRAAVAAALFAGVLLSVAPASADHGRRYRHHRPHHPRVAVFVGLPPIALHIGAPGYYRDRYDDCEDGYDDGYGDRAREERYRRHYRGRGCDHRHHNDCGDYGCDY